MPELIPLGFCQGFFKIFSIMKKAIAMRCTKEQFESVKPKLKGLIKIDELVRFDTYNYLTNFYKEENLVSNVKFEKTKDYTLVYNEWNEKVFLEACGIYTIPTLEEVKEYFKNALEVKTKTFGDVIKIELDKIYLSQGQYFNNPENNPVTIWSKEKGYAEILTYKEKTYSLTKEQLRSITDPQVGQWFPEVFELKNVPDGFKGYVKLIFNSDKEQKNQALLFLNGKTKPGKIYYDFGIKIEEYCNISNTDKWFHSGHYRVEATESEVFEALKNEAVKRGLVDAVYISRNGFSKFNYDTKIDSSRNGKDFEYFKELNIFEVFGSTVFDSGQWAKIIPTKTKAEAEKYLNCKIID